MLNVCCFEGRIASKPRICGKGIFFTLAVRRNFKDKKTGEVGTDFIKCVSYRNPELLLEYLQTGSLISIRSRAVSYKSDTGAEKIIFKIDELFFIQLKNVPEEPTFVLQRTELADEEDVKGDIPDGVFEFENE